MGKASDHEVVRLADPGCEYAVWGASVESYSAPVDGAHVGCALKAGVFGAKVIEFVGRELEGHSDGFGFVERNDGEHFTRHLEYDVVGPKRSRNLSVG